MPRLDQRARRNVRDGGTTRAARRRPLRRALPRSTALEAEAHAEHGDTVSLAESHALYDVVRFDEKPDLVAIVREQSAAAIARIGSDEELTMRHAFATGAWLGRRVSALLPDDGRGQ